MERNLQRGWKLVNFLGKSPAVVAAGTMCLTSPLSILVSTMVAGCSTTGCVVEFALRGLVVL